MTTDSWVLGDVIVASDDPLLVRRTAQALIESGLLITITSGVDTIYAIRQKIPVWDSGYLIWRAKFQESTKAGHST
jgi:hypothetical protein